jgi:hypothetical protein
MLVLEMLVHMLLIQASHDRTEPCACDPLAESIDSVRVCKRHMRRFTRNAPDSRHGSASAMLIISHAHLQPSSSHSHHRTRIIAFASSHWHHRIRIIAVASSQSHHRSCIIAVTSSHPRIRILASSHSHPRIRIIAFASSHSHHRIPFGEARSISSPPSCSCHPLARVTLLLVLPSVYSAGRCSFMT